MTAGRSRLRSDAQIGKLALVKVPTAWRFEMLTTWIDGKRNIQVVHRAYFEDFTEADTPDGMGDLTEVEVAEDSTGLLTIYVRQLRPGLAPVAVKFVGPDHDGSRVVAAVYQDQYGAWDARNSANEIIATGGADDRQPERGEVAAMREP